MTWLDLVALIMATGTPINAWLYEESVVAVWREWVYAWGDLDNPTEPTRFRDKVRTRFTELLTCRFCLSHWVPVVLIGVFYVPSLWVVEPWDTVIKLPIYSLAATRGALCLGIVMRRIRPESNPVDEPGDNQE